MVSSPSPDCAALKTSSVPVIDVSEPLRRETVSAIRDACIEWGFFHVKGHGISRQLLDRFRLHMASFFAVDKDLKNTIRRTKDNSRGFFDDELTKQKLDWKECIDVGPEEQECAWERNQWLSEEACPGFKDATVEYFNACELLARDLLDAVELSLRTTSGMPLDAKCCGSAAGKYNARGCSRGSRALLPSTETDQDEYEIKKKLLVLRNEFRGDNKHTSYLRLNHYPICPDSENNLGISRHTDAGALTVLVHDPVSSLQVYKDGKWQTVQYVPDTLTINIGDCLQVWSNGRYIAAEHRVLANPTSVRYSAPFFYNPSFRTEVKPIVGEGEEGLRYTPYSWLDFRYKRFRGDFEDIGEEVQISNYLRLKA
eukprot:scaffold5382_cov405-Prasinococcus_capsulatus_cf.AAC.2